MENLLAPTVAIVGTFASLAAVLVRGVVSGGQAEDTDFCDSCDNLSWYERNKIDLFLMIVVIVTVVAWCIWSPWQ